MGFLFVIAVQRISVIVTKEIPWKECNRFVMVEKLKEKDNKGNITYSVKQMEQ